MAAKTKSSRLKPRIGRPPAGAREGEKVKDYPQLSIRLPADVKAKLQALSLISSRPQWRLISDAIENYLESRALLALIGPDPDAEQHMHDLGKATGALCRILDCPDPSRARGLCEAHYRSQRRATVEAHVVNYAARRTERNAS